MKLIKNDGTSLELKVKRADLDMVINYELLPLSANKFKSIDRGVITDRYLVKFKFNGREEYITSIINEINLLRVNQKSIILYDIDERFFGDHINHSGQLNVTLYSISKEKTTNFNVKDIEVEFLLNSPSYIQMSNTLPLNMKCMQHKHEGYADINVVVNETYNRQNYFVDREEDSFTFTGTFTLSQDDTALLLNYWKNQRGEPFVINESMFGITHMFGAIAGVGSHTVIIKDITYTRLSSRYRDVKITLIKVRN
jgi:hypothetical protein